MLFPVFGCGFRNYPTLPAISVRCRTNAHNQAMVKGPIESPLPWNMYGFERNGNAIAVWNKPRRIVRRRTIHRYDRAINVAVDCAHQFPHTHHFHPLRSVPLRIKFDPHRLRINVVEIHLCFKYMVLACSFIITPTSDASVKRDRHLFASPFALVRHPRDNSGESVSSPRPVHTPAGCRWGYSSRQYRHPTHRPDT